LLQYVPITTTRVGIVIISLMHLSRAAQRDYYTLFWGGCKDGKFTNFCFESL